MILLLLFTGIPGLMSEAGDHPLDRRTRTSTPHAYNVVGNHTRYVITFTLNLCFNRNISATEYHDYHCHFVLLSVVAHRYTVFGLVNPDYIHTIYNVYNGYVYAHVPFYLLRITRIRRLIFTTNSSRTQNAGFIYPSMGPAFLPRIR